MDHLLYSVEIKTIHSCLGFICLKIHRMNIQNQSKYDVFLSYNWDHKLYVKRLYDYLAELNLKVWIDYKELGINSLAAQLADGINKSRVFMCCITGKYSESENCKDEFALAKRKRKPMIIIMLEPFEENISPEIEIQINTKRRFNCYKDMATFEDFILGDNLSQAIKCLLDTLVAEKQNEDTHEAIKHTSSVYKFANGDTYSGFWKDGVRHGRGTQTFANGDIYEGDFKDGVSNGKGTYKFVNGDIYEGDWLDGVRHGRGIYKFMNGDICEGNWKDGSAHGDGTCTLANGDNYDGDWKDYMNNNNDTLKFAQDDQTG